MASWKLVYLFTLVGFINFVATKAQDYDNGGGWFSSCSNSTTTPDRAFQANVRTLLSYLISNATANKQFYNTTVTGRNHSDSVYGMFMCWDDLPPPLCGQCVANATQRLFSDSYLDCSSYKTGWIENDACMIRFSNRSFFSTVDMDSSSSWCISFNVTNEMNLLSKTINESADEAANSIGAKKYATKQARIYGFHTLYLEAQCTPDLSPQDCRKCLNATLVNGQRQCNAGLARFFYPSCKLRYDVYPFYRPTTTPPPTGLVPFTDYSNTYSPHPVYLSHNCSNNETITTTDTAFLLNLRTLLSSLSSNATAKTGFFKTTVHTLTGLFMCRGDLSSTLCQLCIQTATQRISSECPFSKEAIVWFDHCLLRYSNRSSLSTVDTTPTYRHFNIHNTSNPNLLQSLFTWTLANTLSELEIQTGDSTVKNYGTRSVKLNDHQTLYTLAQCTPDLSNVDCRTCLDNIFRSEIAWCCLASPEGEVLNPSCYMMFGLSQFYRVGDQLVEVNTLATPPTTTAENEKVGSQTIIFIVVAIVVSAAFLSFCCYLRRRNARKSNYKNLLRKNFGQESTTLEGLQFDLTIIKAATNNFLRENKIGKGGFGEVYKGILYDGRHVAVKRLSTSSKQGSVEFKNEILLIAKLQHKNLVTFIGFCLEEQEKILVYEYMPNGSLDYLLFGTRQNKLSWLERYKIIRGTALGLLYLHEYSRLKIIHRDLKPSNVLLDENMNPKISDFGMAKIVEMDQDYGNTKRIVGTYGYMSPEYAMLGQFSEKSDVFSFGVMILEIISGKKNLNSYESNNIVEGLTGYVWRQWKDQTPLSILDSNIEESYSQMEVLKCIHVGLLCVQENPNVRPTVATVISYLNSHLLELPSPQEPAFFLHRPRIDKEIITQESTSSQAPNGSTLFSINEMSTSKFYPR
ncbi:cysteine-rich receptor-like protein kinase 10 [Abrus precatorius]|uniref:Cysteine-rich receptor-like protein kinase 10 n=1 Tax=Abrus precatorius TaxID=3816 RepID=A0A8B8M8Q3_ABRPR|nr:cysteine-rich receptor-like protein kinase 10 [Abrus precatorius]